jgi:hypothetical protein
MKMNNVLNIYTLFAKTLDKDKNNEFPNLLYGGMKMGNSTSSALLRN